MAAWLLALIVAPSMHAESSLFVGISDDWFKWRPETTLPIARDLGVTAVRITLNWQPNQTTLSDTDRAELDHFVPEAIGVRVVVAVFGGAQDAPQTDAARATYCGYVANLVHDYPSINDVVIWNEANLGYFWRPQFNNDGSSASPSAYAALLGACWDELHATNPHVNVISDMSSRGNDRPRATSNVSHSPVTFVRGLGDAYRRTGRERPLLDTVGLHPYSSSSEVPWFDHGTSTQISQGDIGKLIATFGDAFAGTGQPLLGACRDDSCPHVWLLETGFQTRPSDTKRSLYTGAETDDTVLPDLAPAGEPTLDQATQMRNALMLAYCQPSVGAIFNFLLTDESQLEDWQSGLLWADGTRKGSYAVFSDAARSIENRSIDCSKGAWNAPAAAAGTATPTVGSVPAPAGDATADRAPPAATGGSGTGRSGDGGDETASGHVDATPTPKTDVAAPSSGVPRVGSTSAPRRRPTAATRRAIIKLLARQFPRGIVELQIVRSTRVHGWYLADGFERRTGKPIAAWLRARGKRLEFVAIARSARAARGPGAAPCDIRPAFSRPLCA